MRLSRKKFEQKCKELGVGANKSMFFKRGFFQKFGCNPFCALDSINTTAKSDDKLAQSFYRLCQKYKDKLEKSSSILVHFNINEDFAFIYAQEIMEIVQEHIKEDTNIVMSVKYHTDSEKGIETVYLFLEEG